MPIGTLPLAAPSLLVVVALFAFIAPGRRPRVVVRLAEAAAIGAFLIAVASATLLATLGPGTSPVIGFADIGLSVRLDVVSAVMLLLVSFLGWIVLRYAATYLDGEARQGAFTGWMLSTLASVLVLVQAGNLWLFLCAWVATSLLLHRLLLFYPERRAAQRAARKKFVIARLGDVALLTAVILLVQGYGTSDIASILEAARRGDAITSARWAGGFLAVAAMLKSAQFPTHGWLTEVMETPTPFRSQRAKRQPKISILKLRGKNQSFVLLTRFS